MPLLHTQLGTLQLVRSRQPDYKRGSATLSFPSASFPLEAGRGRTAKGLPASKLKATSSTPPPGLTFAAKRFQEAEPPLLRFASHFEPKMTYDTRSKEAQEIRRERRDLHPTISESSDVSRPAPAL